MSNSLDHRLAFCFVAILYLFTSASGSCDIPQPMNNAVPKDLNPHLEAYPENSQVMFVCDTTYAKFGSGTGFSTCQATENGYRWSDPDIQCIAKRCSNPKVPANGEVVGTVYTVGGEVTFRCFHGHIMFVDDKEVDESPKLVCFDTSKATTWLGDVPECRPVECPQPQHIEHGSLNLFGNTFGSRVNYKCQRGFKITGDSERWCQANGSWTGKEPKCIDIKCVDPDTDAFRELTDLDKVEVISLEPGDTMTYTCRNFPDKQESKCSNDGTWIPWPTCKDTDTSTIGEPKTTMKSADVTQITTLSDTTDITYSTDNVPTSKPKPSSSPVTYIIIGVVAAVVVLCLIVIITFVVYRRRKASSSNRHSSDRNDAKNEIEVKSLTSTAYKG